MDEQKGRAQRIRAHLTHPRRRTHAVRLSIAILILVISALPIERNSIGSLERQIFETINGLPDLLDAVITPIMQLGSLAFVPIAVLGALVIWRRGRVAIDLALAGTIAWLLARVIKTVVARGRPEDLLPDVVLRGQPDAGYGYISGHAAVAVALATVAAAYLGPRGKALVIALAGIVAFGRIYVGAHLPLDVAGGAAMGWAVGSLVHFLVLPEILGEDEESVQG